MSDLPGHDHDPDPAALDELRRAFAVGDPSPPPAGSHHDPDADADAGDGDADVNDGDADADDGDVDVDVGDAADDVHDAVTEPTPVQERRDEPEPVDDGPEPTPPSLAADDPDATPEADVHPDRIAVDPLLAAGSAEPAAAGDDHADRHPVDPLIVAPEPEPPADDSSPRIIRIDGYAGSSEVVPAEPGSPPSGAAADVGDAALEGAADGGVISISDDDLPDPVYVEGSLDAEGGGTIVFIENDETGDTLAPESERDMRRGIEPRMRERRVAVKRAQGRRRLKRVLIVAGVIAVIVGVLAVLGSPLFAVRADDVRVTGVSYAQGERLDEIIDDAVGTPVLRLDTTKIEDELEAIPWVDDAEVRTDFPHGLTIDVRERAAISTYQGPDGRFRVLDRDGRVLDVLDLYPYAYVLIGGPDAVDLEPGEFAPQGYAAASELAKNLTSSVRGRVTMIEVLADGSRLTLNLDDGSTVYFGEARDLLAKLVRLEAVLSNGCDGPPGLIDVSTADTTRPDANLDCSTSS